MSLARMPAPEPLTEEPAFKAITLQYTDGSLQVGGEGIDGQYIEVTGPTLLSFTLIGNLKFNQQPIAWVLGEHDFQISADLTTMYTLVGEPSSSLMPLAFTLAVDLHATTPTIFGVRSKMLFVLAPPASPEITATTTTVSATLSYDTDTGSFTLDQGWPLQPGQLLLLPGKDADTEIILNISLVDQSGAGNPDLVFDSPPIEWLYGTPPWISTSILSSGSSPAMRFVSQTTYGSESYSSLGLAAPFHFSVLYQGTAVRSPDPIIMNTTIGDG